VITSIASVKNRPIPDSPSHPSVGTEGDLQNRTNTRKSLDSLRLTPTHLEPLVMSLEDMRIWGYIVDTPDGPGNEKPTEEGGVAKCERCAQPFKVKRAEEAEECLYHWGKPYMTHVNGKPLASK
jgi:RNA exonuclease 1